uniref:Uncharacterized protein n=1 Tax=Arundo donax TaxID=35708 RepID=A0A0A9U0W8_ARUDO
MNGRANVQRASSSRSIPFPLWI